MRAARIDGPGSLLIVDLPEPEPGPLDAVVDVAYSGICGSDVEVFAGKRPTEIVRYPVVPGHEWSGVVRSVGSRADPSLVGVKVVGEGFGPCAGCDRCRAGESVMCETRYEEIGFTRPGGWAEQLVLPASRLHRLSTAADLRSAAVLEPAACSADAAARAAVAPGARVAVVGGGTIGCLVVQLLRAEEPEELVVVDPSERASAMAIRCGATDTVDPSAVGELTGRFDVVIEAAGTGEAVAAAVDLVRRGGRLVLAGIPQPSVALGAFDLIRRRVEVRTVFGAPHAAWVAAVEAFATGVLDPGVLVTHELDLADARAALALLADDADVVGKVLLQTGTVREEENS